MSDYRNFRKDLGMSGDLVDDLNMDKFAKYTKSAMDKKAEESTYSEVNTNWSLDDIRKALTAVKGNDRLDELNGMLPVSSVFEALQSVKTAQKTASYDLGLRNFELYLDRIWKQDREACITVEDFVNLRDHYKRNYPKSAVVDVIDDLVGSGYLSLRTDDLIKIASRIRSQEDYEYEIREAGLDSNTPNHRKAREFIIHLVNTKE